MKTKLIVIVGPSGSGKSYMAKHLLEEYNIPKVKSRTTRPRREGEGDEDYFFVTDREFDGYDDGWKMCSTEFGGYRYTSLYSDLTDKTMCHIVDENGLKELREKHASIVDVFAVRLFMADTVKRKSIVSEERILRDEGKFTMGMDKYNFFMDTSSFEDNPRKTAKLLIRFYQHFDK